MPIYSDDSVEMAYAEEEEEEDEEFASIDISGDEEESNSPRKLDSEVDSSPIKRSDHETLPADAVKDNGLTKKEHIDRPSADECNTNW